MNRTPERQFATEEVANFLKSMEDAVALGRLREAITYWWYLSGYLWTRGLWGEYSRVLRLARRACLGLRKTDSRPGEGETVARLHAALLSEYGFLDLELGHLQRSQRSLQAAEKAARSLGDWLDVARFRRYRAAAYYRMGNFPEVLRFCDLALGALNAEQGKDGEVLPPFPAALSRFVDTPLDEARDESQLTTDRAVTASITRQQVHYLRFSVFLRQDRFDQARQELEYARQEMEAHLREYPYWQVTWPRHLGRWHERQDRLVEAREAYLETLRRATAADRRDLEAEAQLRLAGVAMALDDPAEADQRAREARTVYRQLGKAPGVRRATELLREIGRTEGSPVTARL